MRKAIVTLLVCAFGGAAQETKPQIPPGPAVQALAASYAVPARVGVGSEQKRLTLEDAIQLALRNNLDVAIEKTNLDNARQLIRAAQGAFDGDFRWLPGLSAQNAPVSSVLEGSNGKLAQHVATQDFYFTQLVPGTGAQFRASFENARNTTNSAFASLSPFYTSNLTVGIAIPLLRNRAIDANRARILIRRKEAAASDVQFQLRVIDIVNQVEQAYWDLVAARQDTQVETDAVELAQEQLAQDQRQIKAGALAPVELSAAEAELESRRDSQLSSVTTITKAENNLKLLLLPERADPAWNAQLIPLDETIPKPDVPQDLPGAVASALGQRLELRQLGLQQDANGVQARLDRNQTRPLVSLTGAYSNQGLAGTVLTTANPLTASFASLYQRIDVLSAASGLEPIPSASFGALPPVVVGGYGKALSSVFGGRFPSVQAGLEFDLTLRNRSAEAQLAESLIAGKRLNLTETRARQMIEVEVRNALQALDSARQRIAATEASERAAHDKLESETRLFRNGEATNFLVLTRQNEYLDARRRRVVAQLAYNKALARLEESVGHTLESHGITLK